MNYDHSDKKMFFSLVGIAMFKYISQAVLEVDGSADRNYCPCKERLLQRSAGEKENF